MLSPGSATALVNEALGWLQPDIVQTLHTMLQQHDVHQGERHSHVTRATALPVLSSALAAVLNFLEAQITARQVRDTLHLPCFVTSPYKCIKCCFLEGLSIQENAKQSCTEI